MKRKWRTLPIVYKLFGALVGAIALIIIALIAYLGGYESSLMLEQEEEKLHLQSVAAADGLNTHLERLEKEILFLARLEVMDDIVVRDMDRRITKILEQKSADLGESIQICMIDKTGTVYAASEPSRINTFLSESKMIPDAVMAKRFYFYHGTNLYLFSPVYGSFYTHELLGYIILSYPLENFATRLKNERSFYRWVSPPSQLPIIYREENPVFDPDTYLYDTIALNGTLQGWKLHFAMPKKEALALVYHFQTVILVVFGIGLILMSVLVWIILIRMIKPLRELSDTAMEIALTGDYSRTVPETGSDEIGTLAYSFNALMYSTLVSMKRLEIERENHADKLVSLIVFFNAITRAETKDETIQIAIDQIGRLSNAKEVYYDTSARDDSDHTIALGSVGNTTGGIIGIREAELGKEANERLYAALERMVSLQMERIELLEKAQSAAQAKAAFLSAMSHELRTPLGSVLSLTQYLMTQPEISESTGEILAKIENSAHHLLGVINKILDLAKAEAGKMEPHISSCNPLELIETAVDLVSPLAEDKGLRIMMCCESIELPFRSDPHLFGQVIMNLLSNAIKYTEHGDIKLILETVNGGYRLSVKDSGCGIEENALSHLFDEFYQVRRVDRKHFDGSGLGLALSKQIALILQGDLEIFSEGEGKGTTAYFTFRSF